MSDRYFTGKPCKNGHIAERLVSTRGCLECQKLHNKKWRDANPDKLLACVKVWRERNKDRVAEYQRNSMKNPSARISKAMRSSIHKAIKSAKNGRSWEAVVGYSLDDLISHLKKQLLKGMTFDNYGEWHLDHIVPASSFDCSNPEELKACWALSNLRPLWSSENESKGAKRLFLL